MEHDLRQSGDKQEELQRLVAEEASTSFDLQNGPLVRGRLIRLDEEEHALLITMHHIVSDGWSMGVLKSELSSLYEAFLCGEADPLPELKVQYADYAVWQREWIEGEILQEQGEYWKRSLAGTPGLLELPWDHPRPKEMDYAGAFTSLELDAQLTTGERSTIERYVGYFCQLLEAMVADESQTIDRLRVLPEQERQKLLYEWNDTRTEYPREKCIHELFEEQVRKTPGAVAVVYEDQQLSYEELNRRANRLAHYLREVGVKPDERVAICVERGLEMLAGLLGILKAGGAYVPLDPAYPAERLNYMLQDSDPRVLLTQGFLQDRFSAVRTSIRIINLTDALSWQDQPESNPDRNAIGLNSEHLAYVIYTSGSTGKPKGALTEHRAICNRLIWMQDAYGLNMDDAILQKTPFSFDVSVWEFFWPLLAGARIVMARPEGHKDPAYLREIILRNGITTVHFVPSALQAFLDHVDEKEFRRLVRVICSGEVLPAMLARRFQALLPSLSLHNLYGPTEAAVDVTAWPCSRSVVQTSIPIGRPIANTRIYILDKYGEPVPVGVAGELYIAGAGLARGYCKRPGLTAERFVADPHGAAGTRMYRTGDLARWRADGNLEFLGRTDYQVKIRGFRVELGEIEAVLRSHAGVQDAVVIAREEEPGEKRLAGYVVADSNQRIDGSSVREYLRTRLPEYMIPASITVLDRWPLTPHGKLDRKALPAPELISVAEYRAPSSLAEELIVGIWEQVLGIKPISISDNFFDLGGHSLLVTRINSRLSRIFGVSIPLKTSFDGPTPREMGCYLAEVCGGERAINEIAATFFAIDQLSDNEVRNSLANPTH